MRHGDALGADAVEWRNKHGRFMHRGLLLRPGGLACRRGRAEVEGALINVAASVTELAGLLRVRLDGGGEVELSSRATPTAAASPAIRASAAAPPTAGGVPAALPAAAPPASSAAAVAATDAEAAEAMRASTARCHAAALRSGASALTHRAALMSAAARSTAAALLLGRLDGAEARAPWPQAGGMAPPAPVHAPPRGYLLAERLCHGLGHEALVYNSGVWLARLLGWCTCTRRCRRRRNVETTPSSETGDRRRSSTARSTWAAVTRCDGRR